MAEGGYLAGKLGKKVRTVHHPAAAEGLAMGSRCQTNLGDNDAILNGKISL